MKYTSYHDVERFYEQTREVLLRHEAQNLVPLGNIIMGVAGTDRFGWRDPAGWYMSTVSDASGVRLCAIMTPPYDLTLFATDNRFDDKILACLIEGLASDKVSLSGVMCEESLALGFARMYCAANATLFEVETRQRIYELKEINPDVPRVGILRLARQTDIAFLPYWFSGFHHECFGTDAAVGDNIDQYQHYLNSQYLYLLEVDGTPVTMALISRQMVTVCGISYVYTPPFFRRKGYATSCVAAISQVAFDLGFTRCVLFTDLANPISNSIYQRIGFTPICDSPLIKFQPRNVDPSMFCQIVAAVLRAR